MPTDPAKPQNVSVGMGCLITCGILAGFIVLMIVMITHAPTSDLLAEHGDSFTLVLRSNGLTCDRIVSIHSGSWWKVRCAGGQSYEMKQEPYIVRDGAVEHERFRWRVRVDD